MADTKKSSRKPWGCLVAVIAVILVYGISVGLCSWQYSNQESIMKPFEEHINEYLIIPGGVSSGDPYIAGKVITVDSSDKSIDRIFFDLPKELRASNPEEVGTLILLEWKQRIVGYYTDPKNPPSEANRNNILDAAFKWSCYITIIDRHNKVIVCKQHFLGSEPPAIKRNSDNCGRKPIREIVKYIESLPRK